MEFSTIPFIVSNAPYVCRYPLDDIFSFTPFLPLSLFQVSDLNLLSRSETILSSSTWWLNIYSKYPSGTSTAISVLLDLMKSTLRNSMSTPFRERVKSVLDHFGKVTSSFVERNHHLCSGVPSSSGPVSFRIIESFSSGNLKLPSTHFFPSLILCLQRYLLNLYMVLAALK